MIGLIKIFVDMIVDLVFALHHNDLEKFLK
jgi:hypothetical protein